jgi:hypothetical protein
MLEIVQRSGQSGTLEIVQRSWQSGTLEILCTERGHCVIALKIVQRVDDNGAGRFSIDLNGRGRGECA